MPDHSLPEPTEGITLGVSPKVLWTTVATIVVGVLAAGGFALLDWIVANPDLYAGLPAPVQVVITAAVSTLAVAVAGYRARPGVVVPESGS